MGIGKKPGFSQDWWKIESRARRINDPVQKLRYLRWAMDQDHLPPAWGGGPGRSRWGWMVLVILLVAPIPTVSDVPPPRPRVERRAIIIKPRPAGQRPSIWLVERNKDYEVYSNGLRIDKRYTIANEKRHYPVYDRKTLQLVKWRDKPVGIVYHTTESHQAPFDPGHNGRLRLVGKWLLEYVRKIRSYHFVIDRFGQVHSVVRETDSGNHAGYSVWADSRYVYVNLNPSFLGVAFETQTAPGGEGATIDAAQVHAAAVLTAMLRAKYGIRAENCVTHAQVSVLPRSMHFGNHTDWTADFPFARLGLPNNYELPIAALSVFGFRYNPRTLASLGTDLWKGIALGKQEFQNEAAAAGVSVAACRAARKRRYRKILKMIKEAAASREKES